MDGAVRCSPLLDEAARQILRGDPLSLMCVGKCPTNGDRPRMKEAAALAQ
jgi:hypothetical protein